MIESTAVLNVCGWGCMSYCVAWFCGCLLLRLLTPVYLDLLDEEWGSGGRKAWHRETTRKGSRSDRMAASSRRGPVRGNGGMVDKNVRNWV